MAKFIFIICVFIPLIFARCATKKSEVYYSRSVYEFAIDLARSIAQDTQNHFVASTLSPWILLAYTSLGATHKSLKELQNILRLHHKNGCTTEFFEIAKSIYTPTADTPLVGASAMFVDKNIQVLEKFKCKVKEAGLAEVQQVSAADHEHLAETINDYIKLKTNGSIDSAVQAGDLQNVVMMIVDVLRFKDVWKTPFSTKKTQKSTFYDELSKVIGEVNLMTITDNFNTKYMDEVNATVVELPYRHDPFSMLLFVPYEDAKLSNVISSLRETDLKSLFAYFKERGPQEVMVNLPRFKITSNLNNLKDLLMDMGLKTIFDSSQASLSKISQRPLYVSSIIQTADVEVTEEGTVASAVTVESFTFKSLPVTVTATKPFFFMIVDRRTQIPVFAGAYSKPNVY